MTEPTKNTESKILRARYAELVHLRQVVEQLESNRERTPKFRRRIADALRVRPNQNIRSIEIAPQD